MNAGYYYYMSSTGLEMIGDDMRPQRKHDQPVESERYFIRDEVIEFISCFDLPDVTGARCASLPIYKSPSIHLQKDDMSVARLFIHSIAIAQQPNRQIK